MLCKQRVGTCSAFFQISPHTFFREQPEFPVGIGIAAHRAVLFAAYILRKVMLKFSICAQYFT